VEKSNIELGRIKKTLEEGDVVIYHSPPSVGAVIKKSGNSNIGKLFKVVSIEEYNSTEKESMLVHYSSIDSIDVYRRYKLQIILKDNE
jgi:hypothetical protein